jgi:hypothetical protein
MAERLCEVNVRADAQAIFGATERRRDHALPAWTAMRLRLAEIRNVSRSHEAVTGTVPWLPPR